MDYTFTDALKYAMTLKKHGYKQTIIERCLKQEYPSVDTKEVMTSTSYTKQYNKEVLCHK